MGPKSEIGNDTKQAAKRLYYRFQLANDFVQPVLSIFAPIPIRTRSASFTTVSRCSIFTTTRKMRQHFGGISRHFQSAGYAAFDGAAILNAARERAMSRVRCVVNVAVLLSVCVVCGFAQQQKLPADDLNPNFKPPTQPTDFDKRVAMVPMRDGTKLYTVIVVAKGAHDAPILLTRTCYNAAARAERSTSGRMIEALPLSDEVFVKAGYIRVYQDVRGKYGSEGAYLMTPPPAGSGYNPTGADDTTDAYDTIDWLVKNVPESNGRVGMIGSSYEGFTVVMALLHPHPALKVAAPESPMVDGWMGDDWFHYGAFRQTEHRLCAGANLQSREGSSQSAGRS